MKRFYVKHDFSFGAKFAAAMRAACAAGGFQWRVWELERVFYV